MLSLLVAMSLGFQDIPLREDASPQEPEAGTHVQADTETPRDAAPAAEPEPLPTDAPTLIAQFDADYAQYVDLLAEAAARQARDRYIRQLLIGTISRDDLDTGARETIIRETQDTFDTVDEDNTLWALDVLDRFDFNNLNANHPSLANMIAGLVQHGDVNAQRRLLALIEPLAMDGQFDGQRYALLYDRIAMQDGRPQRFGSQFQCQEGVLVFHELEEAETVDERRASLGMEALEAYQARTREFYGASCAVQ